MFVLGPNQLQRFYQGGAEIAGFRGLGAAADGPEDWVASTTTAFGEQQAGLSRLPDGRTLADAVGAAAGMVPRPGARRRVRRRHRPAGQAARRGPAAARALPPGPGLQPGQSGLPARQDGSLDRARHRHRRRLCLPRLPRRHPGQRAGRLGGQPGRARAGRRAAPGAGRARRQRAGAGRHAARHRPRRVPGRTAGADRPVHPAGMGRVPGRRRPSSAVSAWATPARWRPWTAPDGTRTGWPACAAGRHHPARAAAVLPGCCRPPRTRSSGPNCCSPARTSRCRPDMRSGSSPAAPATLATEQGGSLPLRRGMTVLVPHADGTARLTGDVQIIRCLPPSLPAAGGPG